MRQQAFQTQASHSFQQPKIEPQKKTYPYGTNQDANNIDDLDDDWDAQHRPIHNQPAGLGKARPQTSYKAAGIRGGVGLGARTGANNYYIK